MWLRVVRWTFTDVSRSLLPLIFSYPEDAACSFETSANRCHMRTSQVSQSPLNLQRDICAVATAMLGHTVLIPLWHYSPGGRFKILLKKRSKNCKPSGQTVTFIQVTEVYSMTMRTTRCCFLHVYYVLSTAKVYTALPTHAYVPLPFIAAIFYSR
jgi:hypothetical protein